MWRLTRRLRYGSSYQMIWVHIWIYFNILYLFNYYIIYLYIYVFKPTNFSIGSICQYIPWLQNSVWKGELGRGAATKTSTGGLPHHRTSPKRMVPANNAWTWPKILLVKVEYAILISSRGIHEMHLNNFRYSIVFRVHTQASNTRPQAIYALTHLQSSNKIQTETYPPFQNPITTTNRCCNAVAKLQDFPILGKNPGPF